MAEAARRAITGWWPALAAALTASSARAQGMLDRGTNNALPRAQSPSTGMEGFTDLSFLGGAVVALVLAALLSWLVGRVGARRRAADTLEEVEAPKLYVVYAVVGALTGLIVLRYGTYVGFVIFGIGGLLRFRTQTASTPGTGRLILVTLIGLTCGLDLPHLAVLATAFALVLGAVLDTGVAYRLVVRDVPPSSFASAAEAYRSVLTAHDCKVLGEKQSVTRDQVTILFHAPHRVDRDSIAHAIETEVPPTLRGAVEWEVG